MGTWSVSCSTFRFNKSSCWRTAALIHLWSWSLMRIKPSRKMSLVLSRGVCLLSASSVPFRNLDSLLSYLSLFIRNPTLSFHWTQRIHCLLTSTCFYVSVTFRSSICLLSWLGLQGSTLWCSSFKRRLFGLRIQVAMAIKCLNREQHQFIGWVICTCLSGYMCLLQSPRERKT